VVNTRHPIKIIVWNVRGAGSRECLNSLKEYIRIHKPAIIAILEMHISGKRAEEVCNNIGFQGRYRVEARGFRGGIWVLWDTSELNLNILKAHPQFITS